MRSHLLALVSLSSSKQRSGYRLGFHFCGGVLPSISRRYATPQMRRFIENDRTSNSSSVLSEFPTGQQESLHSPLDTPESNDGQHKGSNDMVSLESQMRIRINEKDFRIADLISSCDHFQMKSSLLEREISYRELQSERVRARTVKLRHAVSRLFSEQTTAQRSLWTDED